MTNKQINNLEDLTFVIRQTNQFFLTQAQRQINKTLTLRNWVIGHFIYEYEQHGQDRAQYGERLFKKLAEKLKQARVKGFSFTNLHLCKQFYIVYPQIIQPATEYLQLPELQRSRILQSVTEQFDNSLRIPAEELINKLSFTHFVELIKCESPLKQAFYEIETIKNNWSVRQLQRAINSMLFERTGLSADKKSVIVHFNKESEMKPDDVFRNPYVLEFLGLEEKLRYQETDLEEAIINHLQSFLLEMRRGFCFEARQRRITFDNTHYKIDLVFYHRILKSHILLDLLCCAQHNRSYVAKPVMCC